MSYWIWIPCLICWYVLYYIFSKWNHDTNGKWVWVIILMGMFPGWALVSKHSKRLMFDGMLYDNIMVLTYVFTMMVMGAGAKFSVTNWIGVVVVTIGAILMRI